MLSRILQWAAKHPTRFREDGFRNGMRLSIQEMMTFVLPQFEWIDKRGTAIYEEEWDLIIVLDACRADLIEEVSDDFSFLPAHVETFRSLASTTRIWMQRNFINRYTDEMSKTVHITSNPFSQRVLTESDFHTLDEVWKYGWDHELGTVPAETVTNRGIRAGRSIEADRYIIHYLQPHFPSIPDPMESAIRLDKFGEEWDSVWSRLRKGEVSKDSVWQSYQSNLSYVLRSVERLLDNFDAERVIITSDHGNAFGEWGFYGHPNKIPISALREVPWIITSATDSGEYHPTIEKGQDEVADAEIESRLKTLGYM